MELDTETKEGTHLILSGFPLTMCVTGVTEDWNRWESQEPTTLQDPEKKA